MATDNLEEGVEVTPEAFQDLQKRLEKAEKKLEKAKARAQQTMQEIWQLDVKLKEEEERANQAEAKLAEMGGEAAFSGGSGDADQPAGLLEDIEQLKDELRVARSEAAQVVELQALVDDLKIQIAQLHDELAQRSGPPPVDNEAELAELRERISQMEADASTVQSELQARVVELEHQLQEARSGAQDSDSEQEALHQRIQELELQLQEARSAAEAPPEVDQAALEQAQDRVRELEDLLREAEARRLEADPADSVALQEAQEQISELESQLAEAEERIAEAQSVDTTEFEARISELQEQLAAAQAIAATAAEPRGETAEDLLEARLAGLRIALHEAEVRAQQAEDRLSTVGGSASVFEDQLAEIQAKVREAEERALEWEEKFHRSEERANRAELEAGDGANDEQLMELQDRISELETELAESRALVGGAGTDDVIELKRELAEAQERVAELESRAGVSIEEYQRLERELEEFKNELEEANKRADSSGGGNLELEDKLSEYRERLDLSDQKAQLLEQKAMQAQERAADFQRNLESLAAERDRLGHELSQAQAKISDLNYRLETSAGSGSSVGLSGGDNRLSEALKACREAELKANQAEIQLKKAKDALSEYEQRANESDRETQRLAFQDGLTGLPNLNLIRQYLEFTVKQSQRYGRASALLVVDLDRFKLINDAMGFKAGDELLSKVAERLQTAIRESDALGRKGEDEFLILLSELITGDDNAPAEQKTNMIRQNIAIVVNRISECLSRPFNIQGQKFYIRASIGVSICPNDADSAQKMLEHADSAMYHAKESGRGRCVFCNNELHKRQERRLTMDSQLRLAMEKGEFVLQYQPIIELNKGKGQIVGVEALLRWNHRIDGLLAPASFLSIAEETGLICQLGQWVCRQSCWQLRQWLNQGHNLFVSFNVSTRQMLQADLAEMILNSVDEFGLQPGLIFVELSEGTNVEEVDLIERVVGNLGKAGVRVAIDDFGVGYSSISRIDLQHIQFLKIDPSLVNGCHQDRAKANICEAAVRLAQSLELRPLAEGVETLAQAKFLSKVGCQYMQGYYIQEPADAAVITQVLNEKRAWKF